MKLIWFLLFTIVYNKVYTGRLVGLIQEPLPEFEI